MSISNLPKWNHNNYYGHFDENNQPKKGLAFFMIRECIEFFMEKEKNRVARELTKAMDNFKLAMENAMTKKLNEVEKIDDSLASLRLYINSLVRDNALKDPHEKKRVKVVKVQK